MGCLYAQAGTTYSHNHGFIDYAIYSPVAVATLYLVHAVSIVRGMEVPLILQRLHDSREVVISIVVIIIVLVFVSSTVSGSSNAHHFCPVFFVSGLDVVVEILVFILCVFPDLFHPVSENLLPLIHCEGFGVVGLCPSLLTVTPLFHDKPALFLGLELIQPLVQIYLQNKKRGKQCR